MRTPARRRVLTLSILGSVIGAALLSTGSSSAGPRGVVAKVKDVNNVTIATVQLTPAENGKTRVRLSGSGLSNGFHGFHIHGTGRCDPTARDTAGNAVPFFTAGGHYNPDSTKTHGAHAGDMPPVYAAGDGTAALTFETDRFDVNELMDADGSAIIIHAAPDNLAHIPATTPTGGERYHSHVDNAMGADTATKATGDAGSRFGCGIVTRPTA